MVIIRQGSHVQRLLTILSYTGEYPVCSLHLLGNPVVLKRLIIKLTQKQEILLLEQNKKFNCKLLNIFGRGKLKTIRIYKAALPILECIHPAAYRYYEKNFLRYHPSNRDNVTDRNHRIAESAAICLGAGIESCPYILPPLQGERIYRTVPENSSFYIARTIKDAGAGETNKTLFSRVTGVLFYPGGGYAVYNSRDQVMNWNGKGESKTRLSLTYMARLNAGIPEIQRAILFGKDYTLALKTLTELNASKRLDRRFDEIYPHIHFVTLDAFGSMLLKMLTTPDWNEKVMELLFDSDDRSHNRGTFTYDANENGVYVLSFLDSDIVRLNHFRMGIAERPDPAMILCYPEQVAIVRKLFGTRVTVKTVKLDTVLNTITEGV